MRKNDLVRFSLSNPYIVRCLKTDQTVQGFRQKTQPPTSKLLKFPVNGLFIVIRARCRVKIGYRVKPGQAEILCTVTGEQGFVSRNLLEKV